MNRNIYHRVEVCFPIYNEQIKSELKEIIQAQCDDNVQAVTIDGSQRNIPVASSGGKEIRSQERIYEIVANRHDK
jgi:polyphosphate kinase